MMLRTATLVRWGLILVGILEALRSLLGSSSPARPGTAGWPATILDALFLLVVWSLAGCTLGRILDALQDWIIRQSEWRSQQSEILSKLGERLALAVESRPAAGELAPSSPGRDSAREERLADLRRAIRANEWNEADSILRSLIDERSDDPRVHSLGAELNAARGAWVNQQMSQLDAARKVNDPERVLEIHGLVGPLLEAEARETHEADLSKWLLRVIHNRLRAGRIQTDVVILAGRVAETFGHTVDGASLRASLPTLRRSAGLCPRCGEPYTGLGDACPQCQKRAEQPAPASAEPITGPVGEVEDSLDHLYELNDLDAESYPGNGMTSLE
jgi:hypothetical protein